MGARIQEQQIRDDSAIRIGYWYDENRCVPVYMEVFHSDRVPCKTGPVQQKCPISFFRGQGLLFASARFCGIGNGNPGNSPLTMSLGGS